MPEIAVSKPKSTRSPQGLALLLLAGCSTASSPPAAGDADAGVTPPPIDAATPVDAAELDANLAPDAAPPQDPTLPEIHDSSGAAPEHVLELVRAALDGLGFDPASGEGPSPEDRVFIGKNYLAWIDETGFHGKMNGLWTLNGAAGDALDFVLKDPDGRPVNLFIPGEDGDGRWPHSYKGAEHLEFPSRVKEPNDPAGCTSGDWCNQYGMNEAVPYTNPAIGWWSACNSGRIAWTAKTEPVVLEELPGGGLRLVYEARLVKEADGDGNHDGDACHADYLFPDGVRRNVFVRVGYDLYADAEYFDRTVQFRNPVGNPTFVGDMSLIGGFVMTEWPNAHYLKRLNRFWRPETSNVNVSWNGVVTLVADAWNDLSTRAPLASDVLVAWIAQPITLAAGAAYSAGNAVTLAHVGSSDNDDVGACLCAVHGGIEMGGGLLHAGQSLPIEGGQTTIEARRRLTVRSAGNPPAVQAHVFEAEAASVLGHGPGFIDGDGWSASTGSYEPGHMAFGPYANDWGGGSAQAVFFLLVDNNTAANDLVVSLDIYDVTSGVVLTNRQIRRHEFRHAHAYQRFALDFDLDGRAGHSLETRVYWHDTSFVKLDKIVVNVAAAP